MNQSVMWHVSLVTSGLGLLLSTACAQAPRLERTPAPATTTPVSYSEAGDRILTEDDLDKLAWRSIGPANMGGRVASICMAPSDWKTWYIGYATGGLWKTTNAGTTFTPIFDDYETSSIGSVKVVDAPSDWSGWDSEDDPPSFEEREEGGKGKIVWVGTGEGNGRNSSSWGNGIYRSTDSGESFEHLGLADAHDMPMIAVDPRDPDVCYVAALGHLWGPNSTRGVYKTSDGGATWDAVLQINENTGACDVAIDPQDPNTVYAAMYMRRRTIATYQSGGSDGGIYKSTDAGATWTKLTSGLPTQTGRIGISIFQADPRIVLATVESGEGGVVGGSFTNRSRSGGVFRSEDAGATWERMSDFNPRAFYFSRIAVDPHDDQRVYLGGWQVYISDDGGRTFRQGEVKVPHVDYHALTINPDDTDHLLFGNDGGLYVSYDRGKTWDFHNHMALGQFYNVAVDDSDPYRVGGGLQDNGSWVGPSDTRRFDEGSFMGREGGITNGDWTFIMGGDGFHVEFDPEDPNIVYGESQGGNLYRLNLGTMDRHLLAPAPKEGEPRFRFNWNAPFFISPHDHTTLYLGGNYVYRLTERGDHWERLSHDLSRLMRENPEVITTVGSDAETGGTVVSLAESPVQQGILWAGTDDGLIYISSDAGGTWRDVTPPEAGGYYVSKIEASHHDAHKAYAAIDGHRSNFFEPILLETTDLGDSWVDITGDMPRDAPPEVVREDPNNPDVLYAGTEHACYVTIDRGSHWVKLNNETLPTVAVDDLKIQGREMDLVAGTHGRSVWILDDVSPLSQMSGDVLNSPFHVFDPLSARPHHVGPYGGLWSDRMFIGKNPERGAAISYWIRDYADESVTITISDENDLVVAELSGTNAPGINRAVWDLQVKEEMRLGNPEDKPEFVAPGTYSVKVMYGEDLEGETTLEVLEMMGAD